MDKGAGARERRDRQLEVESTARLALAAKVPPIVTILALPSSIVETRHARSTLIIGSIASVRDAGHFKAYLARLPSAHHDILLNAVAGTWIPIDVAFSHYQTCDALRFPPDQQIQNGRSTFDKTRGTIMGTVTRMAKETGVTPWSLFPQYQRFWGRGFDGGGISIDRMGPKEARFGLVACRLADSAYFRNAMRGLLTGVTELFSRKVYITETRASRAPGSVGYRVQWA